MDEARQLVELAGNLTVAAVLCLVIWIGGRAIVNGTIVTARHLQSLMEAHDRAITDLKATQARELASLREAYQRELGNIQNVHQHEFDLLTKISDQRLQRAENAEQLLRANVEQIFKSSDAMEEVRLSIREINAALQRRTPR
jgi:hypothetical protein